MRNYPSDTFDSERAAELNAPAWMLETLKLNPSYTAWGPHEDYMMSKDGSWSSPIFIDSWSELDWQLNDLNEVVNFYFEVQRDAEDCRQCEGHGLNPATRQLAEDWYDFTDTGRRWCDKLTQHEVDALWDKDRLSSFPEKPTANAVNDWSRRGMGHDAINRFICVQARAEREGFYGECEHCAGKGSVFTAEHCNLALVLWVLHPRKGCSRGVMVKSLTEDQLPEVRAYLRGAAERNAQRFAAL